MKMKFEAPNFIKKGIDKIKGKTPESAIGDEEFNTFLTTGQVSDEVIDAIREKKNRTPREQAIYETYPEKFRAPEPEAIEDEEDNDTPKSPEGTPDSQPTAHEPENTEPPIEPEPETPDTENQYYNQEEEDKKSREENAAKEVGEFVSKFGLEDSLPADFAVMAPAQKLKVIRGLEQRVVDIVKEGSQTVYSDMLKEKLNDAVTSRANENGIFGKAMKILRKAKVSLVEGVKKQHELKKAENNFFEGLKNTDEGKRLIKDNLETLTKHFKDKEMVLDEEGNPYTYYIREEDMEGWSEEETEWANYFDATANEFQSIPYEWSQETGAKKKKFEKAKAAYEEAKAEILAIKAEKLGDKSKAMLEVSSVDSAVQMEQILNTHPEFQSILQDFEKDATKMDSAKKTFFSFLKNRFSTKVGLTHIGLSALGYGARGLAKGAAVATSATGLTFLAAPIIGGAIGYWRGKIKGQNTLEKKTKESRHGKIEKSNEIRNATKSEHLSKQLEKMISELEKATSEKEKTRLSAMLKKRIEHTSGKIEKGQVNFGDAKTILKNQYKLIEALNKAVVLQSAESSENTKDIEDRINKLVNIQSEKISEKVEEAQKAFIKAQARQGMKMGAGFATAGYAIRWLAEELGWVGEGSTAPRTPEKAPVPVIEEEPGVVEADTTRVDAEPAPIFVPDTTETAGTIDEGEKFVEDTAGWIADTMKIRTDGAIEEFVDGEPTPETESGSMQEAIAKAHEAMREAQSPGGEAETLEYTKVTQGDGVTQTLKKMLEGGKAPEWFKNMMGENPTPENWKKIAEEMGVYQSDQVKDSLNITGTDEMSVNEKGEILLKRDGKEFVIAKYENGELKATDWQNQMENEEFIDTDKKHLEENNSGAETSTTSTETDPELETKKGQNDGVIEFKKFKDTNIEEPEFDPYDTPPKSPSYETKGAYTLGGETEAGLSPEMKKTVDEVYNRNLREILGNKEYQANYSEFKEDLNLSYSYETMLKTIKLKVPAGNYLSYNYDNTPADSSFSEPLGRYVQKLHKITNLEPKVELGKNETAEAYIKRCLEWGAKNDRIDEMVYKPEETINEPVVSNEEVEKVIDKDAKPEKNITLGEEKFTVKKDLVNKGILVGSQIPEGMTSEEIWHDEKKINLTWGNYVDGMPQQRLDIDKVSIDSKNPDILIVEGRGEDLVGVEKNGKKDIDVIAQKLKFFLKKGPTGEYEQYKWERVK